MNADIEHIALASTIDLLLIAPATANIIGKMANGIADDFLSTLYTATRAPVLIAPAMNTQMFAHAAVRKNLDTLAARGARFVEPGEGYLACGWIGKGRLAEPDDIVAAAEEVPGQTVIRSAGDPIKPVGAMAILYGNLAPRGAVIKHSAATPNLLQHTGRAIVFDSIPEMTERIDDSGLDVHPEDVLVLRNAGPKGAPGMPEAGYLPIPKKILASGVKDMVRISDARMSGTAFGTIVLHITPESADGGPLGLVQNGDEIRLDVAGRRIDVLVDEAEFERRRAALKAGAEPPWAERGYARLFRQTVLQADEGCDFDFMRSRSNRHPRIEE
jgi:hypothetical protein